MAGESRPADPATPEFGETWVYESIIGALPGLSLPSWLAIVIQFVLFEGAVLAFAAVYDLWSAVPAGTAAVVVATAGSVEMLRISRLVRRESLPEPYWRFLFGSSIEVVLGVVAFVLLVTYLFVYEPARAGTTLIESLLGPSPPAIAAALMLLVLWDVCYRIGTGWWASVAALWRSSRYSFAPTTARRLQRADIETMGFGFLQLVLVPFVGSRPVLVVALVGHVAAVALVTAGSVALLELRADREAATPT